MSRDATLYIDDMIEACRRVMQYTEGLGRAQLPHGIDARVTRASQCHCAALSRAMGWMDRSIDHLLALIDGVAVVMLAIRQRPLSRTTVSR